MAVLKLEYPFTAEVVAALKVGNLVSLSGRVVTARDRIHRFLAEGNRSPVSLCDGAVYHCGPVVLRDGEGWVVRAAGPTTSMREEPYMSTIIERLGVRLIIGKGGMGEGTRKACKAFGCAYLQAVGGAAAFLAQKVERVSGVHLADTFGPTEAMWELELTDFPAIVTMDASGRSLHRRVETRSRRLLRALMDDAPVCGAEQRTGQG